MADKKAEGVLAGEITHFFPHIPAAVVKVKKELKKGDQIRIVAANGDSFEQEVTEMQIDHAEIEEAKAGQEIGLKVAQKVHEGMKVFLI